MREHDRRRVDEARQVVDVAVRVVAGDAVAEPQHLARRRGSRRARARAPRDRGPGCAPAPRVEQALLGGEERAAAVDVDGAAFQHERARACRRRDGRREERALRGARATRRRHASSSRLWFGVLRPAVEAPVGDGDRRRRRVGRRSGSCRASSSGRSARGRTRRASASTPTRCSTRARSAARAGVVGTRMRTRSPAREVADDLAVDPANGASLPRPVGALVRPGDPGRGVRLPLGRHAEAEARPAWRAAARRAGSFVEQALRDRAVGVDAPVAQERPVPAHVSWSARSHSTTRTSLRRRATPRRSTTPNGSQTNDAPQNSMPAVAPALRGRRG